MSSASIKKIIPCKKDQLVDMVLDIEKYPEFVPWCIEGKVYDKNESADLITFNGDLKVGKSILNETFSSHVSFYKEQDKINKINKEDIVNIIYKFLLLSLQKLWQFYLNQARKIFSLSHSKLDFSIQNQ